MRSPTTSLPRRRVLADLTGDGVVDVITGLDSLHIAVLAGHGDGTFGPVVSHATNKYPSGAAAGDIDHDGDLDRVVGCQSSPQFSVMLQTAPAAFARTDLFSLDLPRAAHVRLRLLDVAGRQFAAIEAGFREPGRHSLRWDATGMRTGVAFLELTAGEVRVVQRVVVVR